jgi:type I site-specific restriction endonuclease
MTAFDPIAAFDRTIEMMVADSDCQLRPYQADAITKVEEAIEQGIRRIMLMAATGSGKTLIASSIVANLQHQE